jgi:predicted Na+-dependent transporter
MPTNKKILYNTLLIIVLLLIPLIAMQFTNEVNWSIMDFVVAGLLLLGTSLTIELIRRKIKNSKLRIWIVAIIIILLLLIWGELAVGIFDTPFAGT